MDTDELRDIVTRHGGTRAFAAKLKVSQRIVQYWLAKKRRVKPTVGTPRRIKRAARNALGYEVDEERIAEAVAEYEASDTKALRRQLRDRLVAFEAAGGRSIELADEIDGLRIALAGRSAERGRGHGQ